MKTTLEMPEAKARAAEQGVPLRQFVTEAVEAKLAASEADKKPWMKFAGGAQASSQRDRPD